MEVTTGGGQSFDGIALRNNGLTFGLAPLHGVEGSRWLGAWNVFYLPLSSRKLLWRDRKCFTEGVGAVLLTEEVPLV